MGKAAIWLLLMGKQSSWVKQNKRKENNTCTVWDNLKNFGLRKYLKMSEKTLNQNVLGSCI